MRRGCLLFVLTVCTTPLQGLSLKIADRWSVQPFVGFGFVAESYAFGGGPAQRAQHLTRGLGLHFTTPTGRPWFVRLTLAEQGFRRETYRGARVSVVRRL